MWCMWCQWCMVLYVVYGACVVICTFNNDGFYTAGHRGTSVTTFGDIAAAQRVRRHGNARIIKESHTWA